MKKRLLAQILLLCMLFSLLPAAAWAAAEAAPCPYIKDVPYSGEISAAKTLTVIATSSNLRIIGMALKAINADSGKEQIPTPSGTLQTSQGNGCYEYSQDFILAGDLMVTGGKWTFEVTSTYGPIHGASGTKTAVSALPSTLDKEFLYHYYTIVDGISGSIPDPIPDPVPVPAPDPVPDPVPDPAPDTTPGTAPDAARYRAIPANLMLRPSGTYHAGALAAVDAGGALVEPGVYVVNSSGDPVTTGPIPIETAAISAANGNGAWGIAGTTTQSFARDSSGIRAVFPNLQPYTRTGQAYQNAQVKYTVGTQTVAYGGMAAFNIPGAKVATSTSEIRAGEAVELRITEARDLRYKTLSGSKSVVITDVTNGANRSIFSSGVSFSNGAATIQLPGRAFNEGTLDERRLDVKIGDIFQTLHATLIVKTAKHTAGSGGSGPDSGSGSSSSGGFSEASNSTNAGGAVITSGIAYVNGSTLVSSISARDIQSAVNHIIQTGGTDVTVKVSSPHEASVDSIQIDFPASAISGLTGRANASLTVMAPLAAVTIPNDILRQMDRSISGFTVLIASQGPSTTHIDLIQDGQALGTLSSGMKVELPVSSIPHASSLAAVLVNPDGTETVLPKSRFKNSGKLAVLVDAGSATIRYQDRKRYFSDVNSRYWASDAIDFASSHGLFQGTSSTTFDGCAAMNRAMLVTVLHRLENTPYSGIFSFADVPGDSYYAQAAAWAYHKGIVQGDGAGFNGSRAVTRQEVAVMLYRYMQTTNGGKGQIGGYYGLDGADQVAGWADEAMRWAVGSGIIQGSNGSLKPKSSATRAEVAQMMANYIELVTQ